MHFGQYHHYHEWSPSTSLDYEKGWCSQYLQPLQHRRLPTIYGRYSSTTSRRDDQNVFLLDIYFQHVSIEMKFILYIKTPVGRFPYHTITILLYIRHAIWRGVCSNRATIFGSLFALPIVFIIERLHLGTNSQVYKDFDIFVMNCQHLF